MALRPPGLFFFTVERPLWRGYFSRLLKANHACRATVCGSP